MRRSILKAPFIKEMCEVTANMYRQGWDERNGGNVSYMLEEKEAAKYLNLKKVLRTIPTGADVKELIGKIFVITGTGKYFKNVEKDPETNLGIVRIAKDGTTAEIYMLTKGQVLNEIPDEVVIGHAKRWNVNMIDGII